MMYTTEVEADREIVDREAVLRNHDRASFGMYDMYVYVYRCPEIIFFSLTPLVLHLFPFPFYLSRLQF